MNRVQTLDVGTRVSAGGTPGGAAGLGRCIGDAVVDRVAGTAVEGVEQAEPVADLVDGDDAGAGPGLGGALAALEPRHRVAVDDAAVDGDVVVAAAGDGPREVALPAQRGLQVGEEKKVQGVVAAAPRRVEEVHVRVVVPDRGVLAVEALADHVVHDAGRVHVVEGEAVALVHAAQDLKLEGGGAVRNGR